MNNIIHADFFDVYKELPKVDVIITDPPYNIASESKITYVSRRPTSTKAAWGNDFNDNMSEEDYKIFLNNTAEAFDFLLKNNGSILLFFDRGSPHLLNPFYERFDFKNMICFIKSNPFPHIRKNNYRSGFELCAWFSKGKPDINFINQESMINCFYGNIGNKKTQHPTEKYFWMIDPLVERHSKENDLVLDPFAGSGTTAISCIKYNRNFICVEKSENFYNLAKNRIKNELSQMKLF